MRKLYKLIDNSEPDRTRLSCHFLTATIISRTQMGEIPRLGCLICLVTQVTASDSLNFLHHEFNMWNPSTSQIVW